MESQIKIIGDRIYLRELDKEDATPRYCSWINDKKVNKYLESKKTSLAQLKSYIKAKKESDNCIFFGIFLKENDRHIGNIKLEPISKEKKQATMGMMIGDKNYWGKGLATAALSNLVDWTFENLDIDTIDLGVVRENVGAVKVYKKVGFKVVGQSKSGLKMKIRKCNDL